MGFIFDAAKALGQHYKNKWDDMQEEIKEDKIREEERQREQARERELRYRESIQSRRAYDSVVKANKERRRNGQPELPLPPRKW